MPKIREDLEGAVYVGGHKLVAGSPIPNDIIVGSHLLDGKNSDTPAATKTGDVTTAYADKKLPELRALAAERNLDGSGNKADIVARLDAFDSEQEAVVVEQTQE